MATPVRDASAAIGCFIRGLSRNVRRPSIWSMLLVVVVASAMFASQPALAAYQWVQQSQAIDGQLTYNGQSVDVASPTAFAPLFQADAALFTAVSSRINTEVGNILPAMVASGGATLQSYSTALDGPITINITPAGALTLSGMTVTINFDVHSSGWLGPIKVGVVCSFHEAFNPTVTGPFNISSGVLGTLTVNLGTPHQNVSCDSDLSVPFLSDLINDQATQKAAQGMQQGLAKMTSFNLNTAAGPTGGFGGLASGIPPGLFVINGVDYGALLKQNLPSLIASGGITASFYPPLSDLSTLLTYQTVDGREKVTYNQLAVSLPAEHLQFLLIQSAIYKAVWKCPPTGSCPPPP